jgi:hypothetical protein
MGSLPLESACANAARSTVSHGSSPSVSAKRRRAAASDRCAGAACEGFADGAVFLTVMHCYEDISLMIAERGGKVGGEIGRAESREQILREQRDGGRTIIRCDLDDLHQCRPRERIDGELRVPCLRAPSDWCLKARTTDGAKKPHWRGPPLCGSTHDDPVGCGCGSALESGNIIVGHRGESTFLPMIDHAHELPRETSPAGPRRYPEPFDRHFQPDSTWRSKITTLLGLRVPAPAGARDKAELGWRINAPSLRVPVRTACRSMCRHRGAIVAEEGFGPYGASARPKLRTTDDYFRNHWHDCFLPAPQL